MQLSLRHSFRIESYVGMISITQTRNESKQSAILYQLQHIPTELLHFRNWVNWKWGGDLRGTGKRAKLPVHPETGSLASVTNPQTWSRYKDAAYALCHCSYNGLGFVFTSEVPYSFLDFDNCFVGRELDTRVQQTLKRFPGAYVEVSPSGKGLKVLLRGKLPGDRTRGTWFECYDRNHYTTLTGQVLQVAKELPDHTSALHEWYFEQFPLVADFIEEKTLSTVLRDRDVLMLAKRNPTFKKLWNGDVSGYGSQSEADMALFGILAFYTQDSEQIERVARKWELARDKWDIHPTYLTDSIEKAIENRTGTYQPRTERRERIEIVTSGEPIEIVRAKVQHSIETALTTPSGIVIAAPCGVGKSSIAATLGAGKNIAWIAERHDMATQVKGLEGYRHIQPCTKENCPEWERHEQLSRKGYSTWGMHKDHDCDYIKQFKASGSAIYMTQHAETYYPTQHSGIVIDEFNPFSWVKEVVVEGDDILKTRTAHWSHKTLKPFLDALLVATGSGKQFFDSMAQELPKLRTILLTLVEDTEVMYERPKRVPLYTSIETAPRVFVPTLVKQMVAELDWWETGREWNSSIRKEGNTIKIWVPRRLHTGTGDIPLVVLDATANEWVMGRLLGKELKTVRYDVQLPQGTEHIAVRTGKGYSMGQLMRVGNSMKKVGRVVKEIRYVLGTVRNAGLITYAGLETTLGDALGIPTEKRGHFWGVRGSNTFEDCDTLIVVGTPIPNLSQVVHFARMLYLNDSDLIREYVQGDKEQNDLRLDEVVRYLAKAELTQAAHRNRPLIHKGRKVVTLCNGEVDFLPATEKVTSIPNL